MIYNNFLIRESYLFVDFFFVLSGYVIALNYNIMIGSDALIKYLKKRFFRLYPLLLYTTLLFFCYYLVLKLMKIYILVYHLEGPILFKTLSQHFTPNKDPNIIEIHLRDANIYDYS